MMLTRRTIFAAAALLLLTSPVAQAAVSAHLQRYSKPLAPAGSVTPASADTYGVFEPDVDMFIHAGAQLGSLRVYDQQGREVPYRPRYEPAAAGSVVTGRQVLLAEPLPQQRRSGQAIFATGATSPAAARPVAHDRIRIRIVPASTSGGFVSTAKIEASNDRRSWIGIAQAAITMPGPDAQPRVAEGIATYPTSAYRFLRVTVPGARTILPAEVELVQGQRFFMPPLVVRAPNDVKVVQDGRDTTVTADFGGAGVPIETIEVGTTTGSFVRTYEVRSANSRSELKQGGRLLRSGSLARVGVRDDTTIAGIATASRYLRITIRNGDDQPLENITMRYSSHSRAILFGHRDEGAYTATYGDAEIGAPSYDLARLPLDPEQVLAAVAFEPGQEVERPQPVAPAPKQTWLERNPWATNALAGVVALIVLGGVVWVLIRTGVTSEPSGPSGPDADQ
jgi:hypothetical protein